MRKYFATGSLAVVALAWSFGMTGCSCQRKGIVLRGDWSFELNRVPHMRSNGPTYSGDACTAPCEDVPCTSDSCTDGTCPGCRGGYVGEDAGGVDGGGGRAPRARSGAGGYYGPGPGGAGGYEGGAPVPAPPQPTPAAQSRFHPVPTRPVFEPQQSVAQGPYDPQYDAESRVGRSGSGQEAGGAASSRRPPEPRRAQIPPGIPRSNRVATRNVSADDSRSNVEPALFEEREPARQVEPASADEEVVASNDRVAEEAAPESTSTASAWRVKTRRG